MVIISHGTYDLLPPLLKGVKILQLWHGVPIKRIGSDVGNKKNNLMTPFWMIIFKIYPHLNNYYCNFFVDVTKSGYYLKFIPFKPKIINMGYPRWNSFLKNNKFKKYGKNKQLEFLRKIESDGIKIILYLPTYRDNHSSQERLEEEIFKLSEKFSNNKKIYFVYKSHFVISNELNKDFKCMNYLDSDPYPLLSLSSALITDYSSIGVDYLILDKPISFFIFDREKYEEYPGCYFDLDKYFNNLISINCDEVYSQLIMELDKKSNFSNQRKILRSYLINAKMTENLEYNIKKINNSI
jgi:CDP-glycerol glycerophosphotransferase (TagB/SpsB family)